MDGDPLGKRCAGNGERVRFPQSPLEGFADGRQPVSKAGDIRKGESSIL